MRRVLLIVAALVCFANTVSAQQGPAYPSTGAGRGKAFPKQVSPTHPNPTNWVVQKHEYTDPYGPNSRRYYHFRWQHYRHDHR
jgi:hypothetical protein